MDDLYLNELKINFKRNSNRLKQLKKKLLKARSSEEQSKIIKKIDSIAKEMEANQMQAKKVAKSRLKEIKTRSKR